MAAQEEYAAEPAQFWAERLIAAHISILPVTPRDKNPFSQLLPTEDDSGRRTWSPFSRSAPPPEILAYWFARYPNISIGAICGEVSENLQVLDVDDGLFARWLMARLPHLGALAATWSVRTGSDKLHIYLRSDLPLGEGEHKLIDQRDKRKLADIRGEGSYVVAPPSIGPTGGQYATLYGAPESIARCADGLKVWRALAAAYETHPPTNGQIALPSAPAPEKAHFPKSIRAPAEGGELADLTAAIGRVQSARARRAILEGAGLREAPWNASDWSDLDWRIVKEVLQAGGLSDEQFEAAWATFPIGLHTYRNSSRPNHGQSYLLGETLPKARAEYERERSAASKASGQNFSIERAAVINYDPEPLIELLLRRTDVEPNSAHKVNLTFTELGNERSLIMAVFRQAHWVMQLQGGHLDARGFRQFLSVLSGMLEEVQPPEGATESGQLWMLVRGVINNRLGMKVVQNRPEKIGEFRFGWVERTEGGRADGEEFAMVSCSALMAHIRSEVRSAPKAREVWEVLEARGAKVEGVKFGKKLEEVWRLKLTALD
jgi:bifunctional DNA primase/polymerase-like protein